jgi:hypothetical protein
MMKKVTRQPDLLHLYDELSPEWTLFEPIPGYNGTGKAFRNSRYVVVFRDLGGHPDAPRVVHLSIHDHERTNRHNWRDLQRIKNEAVEIYPPDRYLVDAANQYHLWCFDRSVLIDGTGIGFAERLTSRHS